MPNIEHELMLKNVRCSFPHLHKKRVIKGKEGKYGCTFLLDKTTDTALIDKTKREISAILKEKNDGVKLKPDLLCLRDGDSEGERAEYAGYWYLTSNTDKRPVVIGTRKDDRVIDPEECKIYAGCRVNAKVAIWWQDNDNGQRVNGTLLAIQYAGEGEPLTGAHVSEEDAVAGFEDIENDDMFD